MSDTKYQQSIRLLEGSQSNQQLKQQQISPKIKLIQQTIEQTPITPSNHKIQLVSKQKGIIQAESQNSQVQQNLQIKPHFYSQFTIEKPINMNQSVFQSPVENNVYLSKRQSEIKLTNNKIRRTFNSEFRGSGDPEPINYQNSMNQIRFQTSNNVQQNNQEILKNQIKIIDSRKNSQLTSSTKCSVLSEQILLDPSNIVKSENFSNQQKSCRIQLVECKKVKSSDQKIVDANDNYDKQPETNYIVNQQQDSINKSKKMSNISKESATLYLSQQFSAGDEQIDLELTDYRVQQMDCHLCGHSTQNYINLSCSHCIHRSCLVSHFNDFLNKEEKGYVKCKCGERIGNTLLKTIIIEEKFQLYLSRQCNHLIETYRYIYGWTD